MVGLGIFYILSLKKALNHCAPENRAMTPGMVWLMLVPMFNIFWHFLVVIKVAKSLGAEFQKRGIAEDAEPGKILGLIMCILRVFTHVILFVPNITLYQLFVQHGFSGSWINWIYRVLFFHDFSVTSIGYFNIGLFVCWILYWVKIASSSGKLAAPSA